MSLLLLMPSQPASQGALSPSRLASWVRSGSKPPRAEEPPPNPEGLLVPKPTSSSNDKESARSIKSNASRGRKLIRDISIRLRSSSSARLENRPLQEKDFKEIEGWMDGFDKYNQLITTQVSKDSTYPPKEFTKICKALTKGCGEGFVHGLPQAMFDLALLWCPAGESSRKPVDYTEPSWSWTGWNGAVNFPFDPTNCPDVRRTEGDLFKSEIFRYEVGPESAPYTIRREKKGVRSQFRPNHKPDRGTGTGPSTESNVLCFKADTIAVEGFQFEQIHFEDQEIPCSELLDKQNRHCGVFMDYEDSLCAWVSEPSTFEFILLSRNRRCKPIADTKRSAVPTVHPPGTPIWNGERFVWDQQIEDFDNTIFEDGEWKMLNVMLIRRGELNGKEYAERVAVGRIHEDVWKAGNPILKEVVLN